MRATVITAACLFLLASASEQQKKQTIASVKDNEIVEQVFSAWNSHDPEKVLAFYADDVVYEDVPLGVINHGKAELRKLVEETLTAFPDLKVQIVTSSIWNNHGVSEVVWGGTDKGFWKTNKQFSVRMLSTFELQGGKFSRNKDFYDLASIMRQVGVLPEEMSGKAMLEAYVSAWNRHDFAVLDRLLTPDAVHEDLAQGVDAHGIAQIKDFMREEIKGAPDLDWRLTTVVNAGPMVAAEWTWSNTFTGDGPTGPVKDIRLSGRGVSVVLTENGRIKRFPDYYDFASFFPKTSPANATVSNNDLSAAKQQVLDLGREWAAAEVKHDASTLRRILEDNFVASFAAKKPFDKEAFIKQIVSGDVDPTESQTLTDETVTIDHDTAVVVGTDTVRGTEGGAAYVVVYRYTATYIRRHGQWLALAEHLVEVPQAK